MLHILRRESLYITRCDKTPSLQTQENSMKKQQASRKTIEDFKDHGEEISLDEAKSLKGGFIITEDIVF